MRSGPFNRTECAYAGFVIGMIVGAVITALAGHAKYRDTFNAAVAKAVLEQTKH